MNKIALIAAVAAVVVVAGGYALWQKTGTAPGRAVAVQQHVMTKKVIAADLPPQPEPPPPPPEGTPNPGKALNDAMREQMIKRAQELQKKNAAQQPSAQQPVKP